ncbi:MAG: precorrin-3B C(17)-methyltransferase [Anaerolineae bacterium]|nr:precorrin-3B C(17)-methyltransferase [Anaerolineae bacterium]MDW8100932.1 precorrin-3B C(17)-methyltransferase [Anaerolineae bacterium]
MSGTILVVGIGPGAAEHMTPAAVTAIERADVIIGYRTYLTLVAHLAPCTPREASGMRQEVIRAQRAVDLALAGCCVAVISGGDPGIYGMAGLIYEVLAERGVSDVEVEIVPGVSALNAVAAVLGAPLMNDFAVISLSDHLTPRETVLRRVAAAIEADFVICLFNPRGRSRHELWERTCELLAQYRPPNTPVGVVRNATRPDQSVQIVTLAELPTVEVDMLTLVVVGNHSTVICDGKMVTRRGYTAKYELARADAEVSTNGGADT